MQKGTLENKTPSFLKCFRKIFLGLKHMDFSFKYLYIMQHIIKIIVTIIWEVWGEGGGQGT